MTAVMPYNNVLCMQLPKPCVVPTMSTNSAGRCISAMEKLGAKREEPAMVWTMEKILEEGPIPKSIQRVKPRRLTNQLPPRRGVDFELVPGAKSFAPL